ncbi:MAG: hypothetical protein LBU32_14415 [Clostridiales bacterium]|jgi:hypothetical protein|nr:hypothetical protein [Clostridiales bacterium]
MLQVAVNMGFNEIYFIGMDNKFPKHVAYDGSVFINGDIMHHFYPEDTKGLTTYSKELSEAAYTYARKYCENKDIKILNATRGGNLEMFERVDFDSLFKSG